MSLDMITRADMGWPALPKNTNTDKGMIAHYDGNRRLLDDWRDRGHAACVAYWQRVRNAHMIGNGWRDVGYAYFCCPDRKVFEGRGVDRIQAAELPTPGKLQDGNTRYVAVTFGTGPGEMPEPGQIHAWHDLRDWLMGEQDVAATVHGHRDFTLTDCPGDVVYPLRTTMLRVRPDTPVPPTGGDPVSTLPVLREGMVSYDVLTLRALLFERFLSERFDPAVTPEDGSHLLLFGWLRDRQFTPDLKADVTDYQKWRFPDQPDEWDGIVGAKTWAQLTRTT